ncbi:MAG TPA: hypothetical protein DEA08_27085 [Planctomycetes bacterium]|nr:hypothetical protein [Planctomycetota bacterium]
MSRVQRRLLSIALQVGLAIGLHAALLAWFAGGEVARVLFTGGHAASPALLLGAGLFFLVRLVVYLLLPGLVLAQVVDLALAPSRSSGEPEG